MSNTLQYSQDLISAMPDQMRKVFMRTNDIVKATETAEEMALRIDAMKNKIRTSSKLYELFGEKLFEFTDENNQLILQIELISPREIYRKLTDNRRWLLTNLGLRQHYSLGRDRVFKEIETFCGNPKSPSANATASDWVSFYTSSVAKSALDNCGVLDKLRERQSSGIILKNSEFTMEELSDWDLDNAYLEYNSRLADVFDTLLSLSSLKTDEVSSYRFFKFGTLQEQLDHLPKQIYLTKETKKTYLAQTKTLVEMAKLSSVTSPAFHGLKRPVKKELDRELQRCYRYFGK